MIVCADDVCVWKSGSAVNLIQRSLQSALDRLSNALCRVGLTVAAEKSCFTVFPGTERRSKAVSLSVADKSIFRTGEDRFLCSVVDAKNDSVVKVRAIETYTSSPANAIRRLCGAQWGSAPPKLLHLHNALVESRIT